MLTTAKDLTFSVLGHVGGTAATMMMGFGGTLANLIPAVREQMLKQVASDLKKMAASGFSSSYDEMALFRSAFSGWNQLGMAMLANYRMVYNMIASMRLFVGSKAPNPSVVTAAGALKPLHSFLPAPGNLLLVNFGSSS